MLDSTIVAAIVGGILAIFAAILGALVATDRIIINTLIRWRQRLPSGFIVFINGGSGVGKTTVASALARKYNIASVLGSDIVREVLRERASQLPDDMGSVLLNSSFLAHKGLSDHARRKESAVIHGFREQSSLLLSPLVRILNRIRSKRDPVIIEGVNLIASQLFTQIPNDPYNKLLFINLHLESEDAHRSRLRERGAKSTEPPGATDRYIQHLSAIRDIDSYLQSDSRALTTTTAGITCNVISIENSGRISTTIATIDRCLREKSKFLRRRHH